MIILKTEERTSHMKTVLLGPPSAFEVLQGHVDANTHGSLSVLVSTELITSLHSAQEQTQWR